MYRLFQINSFLWFLRYKESIYPFYSEVHEPHTQNNCEKPRFTLPAIKDNSTVGSISLTSSSAPVKDQTSSGEDIPLNALVSQKKDRKKKTDTNISYIRVFQHAD